MCVIATAEKSVHDNHFSAQIVNWLAFSTEENSETLESSAINDGRSIIAMFLTVLYKVEGLETETIK